jgi:hypothetical protein
VVVRGRIVPVPDADPSTGSVELNDGVTLRTVSPERTGEFSLTANPG